MKARAHIISITLIALFILATGAGATAQNTNSGVPRTEEEYQKWRDQQRKQVEANTQQLTRETEQRLSNQEQEGRRSQGQSNANLKQAERGRQSDRDEINTPGILQQQTTNGGNRTGTNAGSVPDATTPAPAPSAEGMSLSLWLAVGVLVAALVLMFRFPKRALQVALYYFLLNLFVIVFALATQSALSLGRFALLGIFLSAPLLIVGLVRSRKATRKEEYHGSARFATDEEIRQLTIKKGELPEPGSFILAPPMPERGVKGQVILPRMQTTQHGLILGGTGTGKSRGYFLPNCAQAVDTSLVVTDPKSELWKLTSGFHERPRRYAPADPDASEGFNWIPLCKDARMAELCARAIMQSGNTAHTDQFFIDTESAFLAALFAHASTMKEATPLTAYRLFTRQKPEDLIKQLLESPSEVAREQAVIFMQTDPRYKGAIVPAVSGRLQFMRDASVQRFTSATLDAPDFGRLRREPTAIYWCLREQDIVRLRPLTSLFFTVLLEQLASESEGADGVPVTMMLDEFANIGTIPDFETTISLVRARGVALWLGVQSFSQLDKAYGRDNAQTIVTNCSTKIALHGLDYNTAKYVSDMLGESTIVADRSSFHFSPTGLISVGKHGTEHRKMLMTPDEVMRLNEAEAIIRTGNKYPMIVAKGYYDELANTAPTHALGDAITAEFAPLTMAEPMTAPDVL